MRPGMSFQARRELLRRVTFSREAMRTCLIGMRTHPWKIR